MVSDIWHACKGEKNIVTINETAWRIVELQEKNSTRKLVDSIEEQNVLEELIEESKPALSNLQTQFHSLLYTSFRYPPLKYGSRFGKKTEPSLWYGSLNPETAITEKAYYQFAFVNASDADFGLILSFVTLFAVKLKITRGIYLNKEPFLIYRQDISSPTSYQISQLLGEKMRANNIDGFNFISARAMNTAINVALFNTNPFVDKQPDSVSFQSWQCHTTKNAVEFVQIGSPIRRMFSFLMEDFIVNGVLPFPSESN